MSTQEQRDAHVRNGRPRSTPSLESSKQGFRVAAPLSMILPKRPNKSRPDARRRSRSCQDRMWQRLLPASGTEIHFCGVRLDHFEEASRRGTRFRPKNPFTERTQFRPNPRRINEPITPIR